MNELGNREKQVVGRWANNWVETSYLPILGRLSPGEKKDSFEPARLF